MRPIGGLALAIGAVVGGVMGGLLAGWLASAPPPVALQNGDVAALRAALERLTERVEAFEGAVQVAAIPAAAREPASPSTRLPSVAIAPRSGTAAAGDGPLDPHRLLAEWVASFADGGKGSDFFRMAVAAYAWPLRRELHGIVADRSAPAVLRSLALPRSASRSARARTAGL